MDNLEDLHLLTVLEFSDLEEEAQRDAVVAAYFRGCEVVEDRSSTRRLPGNWPALDKPMLEKWLTSPSASDYRHSVVEQARKARLIEQQTVDAWRDKLYVPDDKQDPRVQSFLEGWRVRGGEIIAIQRRNGLR
jgi:hypothetical protein